MVDDCALGDLLLDPVSVRCRDERKAMKGGGGGGEQMEDRAVHREMKTGREGREMESEDEGIERDEKEKIMQENIE